MTTMEMTFVAFVGHRSHARDRQRPVAPDQITAVKASHRTLDGIGVARITEGRRASRMAYP